MEQFERLWSSNRRSSLFQLAGTISCIVIATLLGAPLSSDLVATALVSGLLTAWSMHLFDEWTDRRRRSRSSRPLVVNTLFTLAYVSTRMVVPLDIRVTLFIIASAYWVIAAHEAAQESDQFTLVFLVPLIPFGIIPIIGAVIVRMRSCFRHG